MTSISKAVILPALLIGALALGAGMIAMTILSRSNVGPLLGILVTGPLGAVAGAAGGIIRLAREADSVQSKTLLAWLGVTWAAVLLYTLFMIGLSARLALAGIASQVVVLLAAILVLYQGDTAARFRRPVLRSRLVALAAMAMMITMTVFPPVTRPWWATPSQPPTNALPRFAIIMDSRFEDRKSVV